MPRERWRVPDRGKILFGLLVFLLLVGFPVWYNVARGKAGYRPEIVKPKDGKCIEDATQMRERHMDVLDRWRDEYVRFGMRTVVGLDGKTYRKSLTDTCMDCHSNKAEFCDRCHDYVGVTPYCFDCHIEGKGGR